MPYKLEKFYSAKPVILIKEYLLIMLCTIPYAIVVNHILVPHAIVGGGLTGFCEIIYFASHRTIPIWASSATLNILLLIFGFIFLGRSCGIRTIFCSLAYSVFLKLFDIIMPIEKPLTDEPLLELCCVIILTAIGSGLVFHYDATSGGTDIIAMILKKYTPLDVGKALLCVDFLVSISAFFVFNVKIGLISVVGVFVRGFLIDVVVENFNSCKYFTIITEKPEEIKKFVLEDLSRGATLLRAEGAYTGSEKTIMYTVCRRFEACRLQKTVHEIDPSAFTIITTSSEIIGSGFRHI